MFRRIAVLAYGLVAYAFALVAIFYAVGFLSDAFVPKSINSGEEGSQAVSLMVNLVLLGLFAVQHSSMARPKFKEWWTKVVPRPIERSTYVLITSLLLSLLYWQWRPMPTEVWGVESPPASAAIWAVYGLGWVIVVGSTFIIDHFDLFGLRHTYLYFAGREYSSPRFTQRMLYRYVRHPIMLGFLVAFWATPTMTVGHLVFSLATTGYILIAIQLEERDLQRHLGEEYEQYRQEVSMLLPWRRG